MKTRTKEIYGVAAEFTSAAHLFMAAEKVRNHGWKRWDTFSPFPIHHMDHAMGMKKSPLGYVVFLGGLAGFLTALVLQFYPSWFDYPLVVHGKPTNFVSVPAFFPIIFELTVLFSAFTVVGALMVFSGLPRFHHPLFDYPQFSKVTDDGFCLVLEAKDPKFSEKKAHALLEEAGGKNITTIRT